MQSPPHQPFTYHQCVTAMIQLFYTDKAEERGIKVPLAGGVTFIQRFGSALNLNIHFHTIALEGVYSLVSGKAVFYHLPWVTSSPLSPTP